MDKSLVVRSVHRMIPGLTILLLACAGCREPSIRPIIYPPSNDEVEGARLSEEAESVTDSQAVKVVVYHRTNSEPSDLVIAPGQARWWNSNLYEYRGTILARFVVGHSFISSFVSAFAPNRKAANEKAANGDYVPDDCYDTGSDAIFDRQQSYIAVLKRGGYAVNADFVVVLDGLKSRNCWWENVGHAFRRRHVSDRGAANRFGTRD